MFGNDSVAQLDRAFGYEPKGRVFESLQGHHSKNTNHAVFKLRGFLLPNLVEKSVHYCGQLA